MRTLTATEMDVVAGGTNSLIESLAQCTYDTLIGGAAGAAVGAALAGPAGRHRIDYRHDRREPVFRRLQ